jgi:hypothetical protein
MEAGSLENDDYITTPKKIIAIAGNVPYIYTIFNF